VRSKQILIAAAAIALAALPLIAMRTGADFYIGLASRILIYAIAATSLNLLIGYGGMVSFGHAAFLGVGAYTVAILAQHVTHSAWLAWPAGMVTSALTALVVGAISLRTRGVYFIMITLAFAQMLYYFFAGLKGYGGDDGLALSARSTIGLGLNLGNDATFYYIVLALFLLVMVLFWRATQARFGRALTGITANAARMEAIGFPTYRLQLAAFVLAGAAAGLAGALLVNLNSFVSPKTLHWTQSGVLMAMVILGGVGSRSGGAIGAAAFLLLEEILASYSTHWQLPMGLLLLAAVLVAPRGIAGWFDHNS
jgi:branched-chain amino acid transport system permease protein